MTLSMGLPLIQLETVISKRLMVPILSLPSKMQTNLYIKYHAHNCGLTGQATDAVSVRTTKPSNAGTYEIHVTRTGAHGLLNEISAG